MKGTESEDDPMYVKELFKYQNIASRPYSVLDGLISECGPTISVSMAYFMGEVNGKRKERRRNQNRLKRMGI